MKHTLICDKTVGMVQVAHFPRHLHISPLRSSEPGYFTKNGWTVVGDISAMFKSRLFEYIAERYKTKEGRSDLLTSGLKPSMMQHHKVYPDRRDTCIVIPPDENARHMCTMFGPWYGTLNPGLTISNTGDREDGFEACLAWECRVLEAIESGNESYLPTILEVAALQSHHYLPHPNGMELVTITPAGVTTKPYSSLELAEIYKGFHKNVDLYMASFTKKKPVRKKRTPKK